MHDNMKLLFYRKSKRISIPKKVRVYNIIICKESTLQKFSIFKNNLPSNVDLRNKFSPVYDQGQLGSCTANALCALVQYIKPKLQGSRLFLYYNERKLENNIPDDYGATLSSGIKCLLKYGVCPETVWPYIINKFAVKPTNRCYMNALNYQALKVNSINDTLQSMKTSLSNGNPFVVGIAIYQSFESNTVTITGIVPMPNIQSEQLLGGHAIVCVGYNDLKQQWIMRNSWGSKWGEKGYFYLPYAYLLNPNLASDMWTITKME
jgi:C1A family cysteine protease